MGNLLSALGMLSTVVLILALAYWTSRWIATHSAPGRPREGDGGQFRVVARLVVGRNAYLLVLRARERCLLLGVTEHNITLLKEWEGEEAEAWLSAPDPETRFLDVLRGAFQQREQRPRRK